MPKPRNALATVNVDDIRTGVDNVPATIDQAMDDAADDALNRSELARDGHLTDDNPLEVQLSKLLSETDNGEAAKVIVYRVSTDPGKKDPYLYTWLLSEFSQAALASAFGGGTYRWRAIHPRGYVLTHGVLTIEEPKNKLALPMPKVEQPSTNNNDVSGIVAQIMEALKPLITKPERSMVDILNEMKLFKDVFQTPTAPVAPAVSMMQSLKEAVELHTLINGLRGGGGGSKSSGGGDNIWGAAMAKLVEQFAPSILEAAKTAKQANVVRANTAAIPTGAPTIPLSDVERIERAGDVSITPSIETESQSIQPAQTMEPAEMFKLQLKMALSMLVDKAAANADPNLYAAMVWDNISDDKLLQDVLTRADWFEYLSAFNDGIKPYHAWFISLHAELVEIAKAENFLPVDAPAISSTAPESSS